MSSSDQAKSKLLDSMRMSKQGSSGAPAAAKPAPAAAPAKKAPAKKAPASKAPASKAKAAAPKKPITDNFQAAQRVWPD